MSERIKQQAEQIKIEMTKGSWNDSVEVLANLLRELEAARAVADALAEYIEFTGYEDLGDDRWLALCDALAQYQYRARAESNGKEKAE